MMTFYAAAGSYQIRSEDGKNMPYIMRLGKLQPVSIPEFSLWSMLLWDVLTYSQFERALEELNSIGVVRINIMVDSDYQVKEEVRKARDRYIEMGVAAGFEVAPITWTQKRKGVDDLYKHLFRNK